MLCLQVLGATLSLSTGMRTWQRHGLGPTASDPSVRGQLTSMLVLLISLICSKSASRHESMDAVSLLLQSRIHICICLLQLLTFELFCVACLWAVGYTPDCIKLQHVTGVGAEHPAVLVRLHIIAEHRVNELLSLLLLLECNCDDMLLPCLQRTRLCAPFYCGCRNILARLSDRR